MLLRLSRNTAVHLRANVTFGMATMKSESHSLYLVFLIKVA